MKNNLTIWMMVFLTAFCLSCAPGGKTIKIGVAAPMTGSWAKMGNDILNGVKLAVEEWNARGGILGKKIEIISEDDQGDPRQAVSVATKLVNLDVIAVVGHYNSSASIPASAIYNEAGIVQITPSSTNPEFTQQGYKQVFRVCGTDDQQGEVGAKFVLETLKKKKVAVLHDKTTYGQGLADEFKKYLTDEVLVVAYEGITAGEKDFSAVLTKIKKTKPEVLYFGGYYPEAGLLVKQMKALGLNAIFISGDATIDPEFIKIGGKATEGTYLTYGTLGPSGEMSEPTPQAQHFISAYRTKFGELGPYSIYAYDAANVIFKALSEIKTTDGAKLAEALHSLRSEGAKGPIEFDEKGDMKIAPYIFWVVKDGKFVPAKP
ncbi:MAG: branched-chain amino acid ABC transporter substrate-binding protein [Candidatus Edwardsbacteria bacterium]